MTFGALLERHPVPKHITLVRPLQGWGVLVPVQSRLGRLHILLQGSQAGVHLQQAAQRLALHLQTPPCVAGCRRPMTPDAAARSSATDSRDHIVIQLGAATARPTFLSTAPTGCAWVLASATAQRVRADASAAWLGLASERSTARRDVCGGRSPALLPCEQQAGMSSGMASQMGTTRLYSFWEPAPQLCSPVSSRQACGRHEATLPPPPGPAIPFSAEHKLSSCTSLYEQQCTRRYATSALRPRGTRMSASWSVQSLQIFTLNSHKGAEWLLASEEPQAPISGSSCS